MESVNKTPYKLTASLICADILNLKSEIELLDKGGIDYIHFDVMDGDFVPRLGLHPEVLKMTKSLTNIPVDVHMMINSPELFIPAFAKAGADIICPHAESTQHLHRVIKLIKDQGVRAGVALNPGTPLCVLDHILEDIELVVLMAINPGIVGHKLIPGMLKKIVQLKEMLKDHPNILIEIDGGVSPESSAEMIKLGADMLVCGTSTIFKPNIPVDEKINEFKAMLDQELRRSTQHDEL
ncbi:ribulose-phosphate 3-epimerase [Patescibacteria group bacterium]|nr:ribulose-phosphate 3-epimerase [Patescibacteria group bacterium]MBU2509429.1 ribulose-phosphate 3-epimerase [Patescibacteria group bacterium]